MIINLNDMKKTTHSISPFIILLVPVLLATGIRLSNGRSNINPEKYSAASYFKMPDFKGTIWAFF